MICFMVHFPTGSRNQQPSISLSFNHRGHPDVQVMPPGSHSSGTLWPGYPYAGHPATIDRPGIPGASSSSSGKTAKKRYPPVSDKMS